MVSAMNAMEVSAARRDEARWTATVLLLVLALIPTLSGAHRVWLLAHGSAPTAEDARIAARPVPMLLHAIGATLFNALGALQFAPSFTSRHRRAHRAIGWLMAPMGVVGALSGVWMALFHQPPPNSNALTSAIRVVVGTAMAAFIVRSVLDAKRGSIRAHRAWMTRAYAIGCAAGTQALLLGPLLALSPRHSPYAHTAGLALGWLVNIVVAERLLARTTPAHHLRR